MYPDKYMRDLYKFAKDNGALVCFDEVQAGFYRMGELYGYMTYGNYIKPDLVCLGKGISSSLPMSALLTTKDILDVDKKAVVGGTHSGNPVCCAASLANIEFLTDKKFQKDLKRRTALFEKKCKELLAFEAVKEVNCKGMVAGIIFETEEEATDVVRLCIMEGVLPVCTFKNSVKLGPPLTITEEAIEEAFDVFTHAVLMLSWEDHTDEEWKVSVP